MTSCKSRIRSFKNYAMLCMGFTSILFPVFMLKKGILGRTREIMWLSFIPDMRVTYQYHESNTCRRRFCIFGAKTLSQECFRGGQNWR